MLTSEDKYLLVMNGEVDPEKCITRIEKLPNGQRIVWRRCPICYQEIYDPEDGFEGFRLHLSTHNLRVKEKT